MTRRITTLSPSATFRDASHDLDWYTRALDGCCDRFEIEVRLLQALDDRGLSDDDFHTVRLHFDRLAEKGWPS